MKELKKLSTAKEKIIRFLVDEDIMLAADDEAILARWEFADRLMRRGITNTETLIKEICKKFSVSEKTADKDITNSMDVFSKSRQINKKYIGHLHLQDISEDLKNLRKKMFAQVDDADAKNVYDHKDVMALAKLHDSFTYQLNSLPDDLKALPIKRPVFIFQGPAGANMPAPMPFVDAMAAADEYLKFEDIKDGNNKLARG